ncbi:MAG: hypothetical protein GXY32_11315 [Ruminococcaceae bacterium]|nr:hypothetical protein [Oscillospiraceae bacterium]
MIVKDAAYEKRNLGVGSYEITIEDDTFEAFLKQLAALPPTEYLVVRTPVCRPDFLWGMQEAGFTFMESMIHAQMRPEALRPLDRFAQFENTVSFAVADDAPTRQAVYDRVRTQLLYTTDRISLDRHFSVEAANRRYANWMADAYNAGSQIVQGFYEGTAVFCFFVQPLNKNNEGSSGILSLYPEGRGKGLGPYMIYEQAKMQFDSGASLVRTGFSSNNTASIRAHLSVGYGIERMEYVYVRHLPKG